MRNRWIYTGLALVIAGWLGSCTPTHLASGEAVDDLYTSHNRRAIAESEAKQNEYKRKILEQRAMEDIMAAGQDNYYSYNSILSNSYEESYERRLKGFESPTYRMPGSYYNFYYGNQALEASTYDPAFYNVIVMGDEVWVEPRYITSMFGNWGTSVNINLGWGWNSWYRPYWGWNYSPYWGSYYAGWYDPWYSWGGCGLGFSFYWGHHHHHHHGNYWGGGNYGNYWGYNGRNNGYTRSTNRRDYSMGNIAGSSPGRYNNSVGNSNGTSYRRGTGSDFGTTGSSGSNYRRGTSGNSYGTTSGNSGSTYRRGSSTDTSSSGNNNNSSYNRRESSSSSSGRTNNNSNSSSGRRENSNSSGSYRSSGSYGSGSSSGRSSGTSSSRGGGSSSGRSSGGRR